MFAIQNTSHLGPLRAGETFKAVAADYGVSEKDLRTALDAIAA